MPSLDDDCARARGAARRPPRLGLHWRDHQLWDADAGKERARLEGHGGPVDALVLPKALEEELGVTLLARNRRSVRLTASGETFLRRARGLLEQAAGAATEARRIGRGEVGSLAIGFMTAAMLGRLPSLLTAFRGENAAVTIDLVQLPPQEQIEALDTGRIDLGFVAISAGPRHPALERYRLPGWKVSRKPLALTAGPSSAGVYGGASAPGNSVLADCPRHVHAAD
jgi:DNA-binding transcriptional LysR family regulator